MKIRVESILGCPAQEAWQRVQRPAHLVKVASPMARIVPLRGESFPERWQEAGSYRCRSYLFGVLPVGVRHIFLERIDHGQMQIQSREHDALIKRWDHLISIAPVGEGCTRYCDEIIIEAGWLTPVVGLWAYLFYRHRQRRARQLLPDNDNLGPTAG